MIKYVCDFFLKERKWVFEINGLSFPTSPREQTVLQVSLGPRPPHSFPWDAAHAFPSALPPLCVPACAMASPASSGDFPDSASPSQVKPDVGLLNRFPLASQLGMGVAGMDLRKMGLRMDVHKVYPFKLA